MDSLITAAARALASGDPLGALKRVALRTDPAALALRGIAMAQLGDFARAKMLLRRAGRAFGPREAVSRARCVVAEAEIALISRDLGFSTRALAAARITLEAHGDRVNGVHAQHVEARRLVLIGQIDQAERMLASVDTAPLPSALRTAHELIGADIAVRRLRTNIARAALARAGQAAVEARNPALTAEVQRAALTLTTPTARLVASRAERLLVLAEVEELLSSNTLVVDGCRRVVRAGNQVVSLATRPVLFALAQALGKAWPGDVSRDTLIMEAFGSRHADESHRARLRVEVGRLRRMIRGLANVEATREGFALAPRRAPRVVVLLWPVELDDERAGVLAFLADGESWSSSALAVALGRSQRTVQRALDSLAAAGRVQAFGRGRARRWMTPPLPGFTTTLLLPSSLPTG